jgi:hypothetical protein
MELDLQSLFGILCTAVLYSSTDSQTPHNSPLPRAFGLSYEGAIGQPKIDEISL